MAILEEEVWVGINHKNIKHYESLGYVIPKRVNSYGRYAMEQGTKIFVKINDITKGSNISVTKICDDCGAHIINQPYNAVLRSRKNNIDRCLKCTAIHSGKNQKNNVKYSNTLEFMAKKEEKYYLLEEFSIKNTRKPNQIAYKSNDLFWWECRQCGSEFETSLVSRTNIGSGCPYCTGKKINHTNNLWTTHPEIACLLKNYEEGFQVTHGSSKKLKFKCNNCGNENKKAINKITINGYNCPNCGDGVSYPEKFLMSLLEQLNVIYEKGKIFNWSSNKIYDFYIPSLSCIIETHGGQHYYGGFESLGGRSLTEEKDNDKNKEIRAKANEIDNYIVIDCRRSTLEYIKNNIIKSELSEIFNLSKINWLKCHEDACNSLVKIACDMWKNSSEVTTTEIGKTIGLNKGTIRKYLKQGVVLGWCDYDPKKEWVKIVSDNGRKSCSKKVVQLSIDNKFIKEYPSLASVGFASSTVILKVCKGLGKTAGGFKWMYKEDYDRYIEEQNSRELQLT